MDQAHGVAGIDPHKATATVAVIEDCGGRRGCRSFTIDKAGIDELQTFLIDSELVIDRIGIEGSAFLGRPLVDTDTRPRSCRTPRGRVRCAAPGASGPSR